MEFFLEKKWIKKNIKSYYNDEQRLDTWLGASCLSITKRNSAIFPKFVEKKSNTNESD